MSGMVCPVRRKSGSAGAIGLRNHRKYANLFWEKLQETRAGGARRFDNRRHASKTMLGMTTANKVTILRILLIPVFVVEILYYFKNGHEIHRTLGLCCFAIASILDGVDGYIARHYNQRSELGAILDPLADKLLLVSAVVLLSLPFTVSVGMERIPLWVIAVFISRDVIILLGLVTIQIACGKVIVQPRIIGKIGTVLQMIMVIWALLKWDAQWVLYWADAAAVCIGISGLLYVWDGMRQLSASPHSLPKPKQ
jgi:cardiolipin synthase